MAMVRELPENERPRERLLSYGAQYLSNAELLALLLRSGSKDKSVLQLAEQVLCVYKEAGISSMMNASPTELTRIKGIGKAKAAEIIAAVELGRRLSADKKLERCTVKGPEDVAAYAMPRLRFEQKENFAVVLMNIRNQILSMPIVSVGSLTSSIVHPREVFKVAVQGTAASIILVHNHPSGDPTPSKEDVSVTRRLVQAGKLMDIPVLDHVVIGDDRYISLKEQGLMS